MKGTLNLSCGAEIQFHVTDSARITLVGFENQDDLKSYTLTNRSSFNGHSIGLSASESSQNLVILD